MIREYFQRKLLQLKLLRLARTDRARAGRMLADSRALIDAYRGTA